LLADNPHEPQQNIMRTAGRSGQRIEGNPITELLITWSGGDQEALAKLTPATHCWSAKSQLRSCPRCTCTTGNERAALGRRRAQPARWTMQTFSWSMQSAASEDRLTSLPSFYREKLVGITGVAKYRNRKGEWRKMATLDDSGRIQISAH
jgi:hypothetical protein